MNNLQIKYAPLIAYAKNADIENLSVTEKNDVLYVTGSTTTEVKDKLWEMYEALDPEMRSGDMVLNIEATDEKKEELYTIKSGDSLSKIAKNYPGMTWQKIYEANKDTIKDPNLIYPGRTIRIPLD